MTESRGACILDARPGKRIGDQSWEAVVAVMTEKAANGYSVAKLSSGLEFH